MKKIMTTILTAVAAANVFALSLAEASAKITSVVGNPSQVTQIMAELSKDNQATFLARVNAAIASSKNSPDSKTATFLAVNKAALLAHKNNLKELIAEVYATVPPASLTVVNERLAADLFNRNANPARPISDEQMVKMSTETMKIVHARNAGNDNASVRDVFAILMFVRASNGTPADLTDKLLAGITDNEARTLAKEEWVPAALGKGQPKSYDAMLAVCDVEPTQLPSPETNFLNLQGPDIFMGTLIADLAPTVDAKGAPTSSFSDVFLDPNKYALPTDGVGGLNRVPRSLDHRNDPWYPGYNRGEAEGYFGQTTRF